MNIKIIKFNNSIFNTKRLNLKLKKPKKSFKIYNKKSPGKSFNLSQSKPFKVRLNKTIINKKEYIQSKLKQIINIKKKEIINTNNYCNLNINPLDNKKFNNIKYRINLFKKTN